MQRTLIIIGIIILLAGITWPWLSKIPFGKLPGDIVIERENFKFYFPIVTMVLLSAILSLILWLFRK
ncbi:MAG: DUF2905 domain-containing protein [Ignavibacteria bacterium]|jgi:hypothetical protein